MEFRIRWHSCIDLSPFEYRDSNLSESIVIQIYLNPFEYRDSNLSESIVIQIYLNPFEYRDSNLSESIVIQIYLNPFEYRDSNVSEPTVLQIYPGPVNTVIQMYLNPACFEFIWIQKTDLDKCCTVLHSSHLFGAPCCGQSWPASRLAEP
jgi:hypothetical protein